MGFGRGRGKVLSHCNVCYWTFMRGEENEKEKMSWWLTTVAKIEKMASSKKMVSAILRDSRKHPGAPRDPVSPSCGSCLIQGKSGQPGTIQPPRRYVFFFLTIQWVV